MAAPTSRAQRRIAKEIMVELARPDAPEPVETATTQNISEGGMRLVTESVWCPGDGLVLRLNRFSTEARVVYCQRLENMGFAVGLELSTPIEDLAKRH
jgi:hypothetical protein